MAEAYDYGSISQSDWYSKFVDNFVVGLNVCGNSPRRSVDPINIIKDTSTSDHVLPLCDWISII